MEKVYVVTRFDFMEEEIYSAFAVRKTKVAAEKLAEYYCDGQCTHVKDDGKKKVFYCEDDAWGFVVTELNMGE